VSDLVVDSVTASSADPDSVRVVHYAIDPFALRGIMSNVGKDIFGFFTKNLIQIVCSTFGVVQLAISLMVHYSVYSSTSLDRTPDGDKVG
jgi:hypothetical protein